MKVIIVALLLIAYASADCYLHYPRGSNNRLDGNGVNRDNDNRLMDTQNNAKGGYNVGEDRGTNYYYQGSRVQWEWTVQHGCGPNPKVNCDMVMQYLCRADVRDGNNENTPSENQDDANAGLHETRQYYADCKARERNQGLFTADQNLNGDTAIYTRQNPNGGRSGYECAEERDYYPYWHPSEWKDIAVLTNHPERCEYYKQNSMNVMPKGYCADDAAVNNEAECNNWQTESHNLPPPDCQPAPWSRDNHLGNTLDGQTARYLWSVPQDMQGNCVVRLRYNMSSEDYDGWNTYSEANGDNSPIENDPQVDFGIGRLFQLAIDTTQFGRTFQDRSHHFVVNAPDAATTGCNTIWNLNVRGKRGNIVQTYPAVEYDFIPNALEIRTGDCVHYQWTGSDNNPANYAGQGTAGTDKSNIVQVQSANMNFPKNDGTFELFNNDFAQVTRFALLDQNNAELNDADAYFDGGIIKYDTPGTFYFMCTRNNNFTNRSQKSKLTVIQSTA